MRSCEAKQERSFKGKGYQEVGKWGRGEIDRRHLKSALPALFGVDMPDYERVSLHELLRISTSLAKFVIL